MFLQQQNSTTDISPENIRDFENMQSYLSGQKNIFKLAV